MFQILIYGTAAVNDDNNENNELSRFLLGLVTLCATLGGSLIFDFSPLMNLYCAFMTLNSLLVLISHKANLSPAGSPLHDSYLPFMTCSDCSSCNQRDQQPCKAWENKWSDLEPQFFAHYRVLRKRGSKSPAKSLICMHIDKINETIKI